MEIITEFTINDGHLKMLKRMNVVWNSEIYEGAPEIDIKRPYGNKMVILDIKEIITGLFPSELLEEEHEKYLKLHREMEIVLQICLCTLSFETGKYIKRDKYNYNSWIKFQTKV